MAASHIIGSARVDYTSLPCSARMHGVLEGQRSVLPLRSLHPPEEADYCKKW
ncbi:hypothetical protein K523DRAFT_324470 [Schizophyllum commune Tattone D]|nr:hypothetical protein K523DRAFT_324470 [Schizophyllum commune Tattone D]